MPLPERFVTLVTSAGVETGTAGNPLTTSGGATGTKSNVAAAAADTLLLAANTARLGATVFNDSSQVLYLSLGAAAASVTSYTAQITANAYYEVPFGYTGAIRGIWAAASGNARVTEVTA